MRIEWIRGNDRISFSRPNTFFVQGIRGSGKSTLLETLGTLYLNAGHCLFDLFCSRDGENLCWLRSPHFRGENVLLLKGESVDVEAPCPVKNASKLSLSDFDKYDIVISSPPLYSNMDDEFINAAHTLDKIYRRMSWKRLIYMLMREASNFLYSRLKVTDDQTQAKTQAIYMLREGRHCGLAFGLDSVRFLSIDIDIRELSDFLFLKAQGMSGLTRSMRWLYRYYQPYSIQNMRKDVFAVLSKKGSLGKGTFKEIPWHKQEKENVLGAVGVKVEYGEPVEKGEYRGTHMTVGDREHAEIIQLYVESGLGMVALGRQIGRSSASVKGHIDKHNRAVSRSGFCPPCRRVSGKFEGHVATKG